jgi:protein TonB
MFETLDRIGPPEVVKRILTFLLSMVAHALAILLFCILPLLFLGVLPEGELLTFLIAAPAPPPPPVPPVAPPDRREASRPILVRNDVFTEPRSIPPALPPPEEEPQITSLALGILNSQSEIQGGVVGMGSASGLGNLLIPNRQPALGAAPAPPRHHDPIIVGGVVQESKLITRVSPVYPALAVRARVSGVVILQVNVDEEGNVYEITVLKGHPLLEEAAISAVRQWKYSPTLLNGEPVPVIATVTVIFNLR